MSVEQPTLLLRVRAGATTLLCEVSMTLETRSSTASYSIATRDGVTTIAAPHVLDHVLAPILEVPEESPADIIVVGQHEGVTSLCVTASRRDGVWRDLLDPDMNPTRDWLDVRSAVLASLVGLTRLSVCEIPAEVRAA